MRPDRVGARGARGVAMRAAAAVVLAGLASGLVTAPVRACDLCAIYATSEAREDRTGLRLGVAQQFTYFRTWQRNDVTVPNPGERLASSITQVLVGYNFHRRLGVQLNLPIISRHYTRLEGERLVDGDASGLGDLTLLAIGKPFEWSHLDRIAHLVTFAGLKLPSGGTSFLREEVAPPPCIPFPDPTACSRRRGALPWPQHRNGTPSGLHGHDLTLGSGSVDGVLGAQVFATWDRYFATASVQYMIRGTGAFDYRYANDLLFSGGPGLYLFAGHLLGGQPWALRAQALLTGESKGTDTIDGQRVGDTGYTGLYLGPALAFAWGLHLGAELALDVPVLQHNSGLQIVPDYRLRGALTWRF